MGNDKWQRFEVHEGVSLSGDQVGTTRPRPGRQRTGYRPDCWGVGGLVPWQPQQAGFRAFPAVQ